MSCAFAAIKQGVDGRQLVGIRDMRRLVHSVLLFELELVEVRSQALVELGVDVIAGNF